MKKLKFTAKSLVFSLLKVALLKHTQISRHVLGLYSTDFSSAIHYIVHLCRAFQFPSIFRSVSDPPKFLLELVEMYNFNILKQ